MSNLSRRLGLRFSLWATCVDGVFFGTSEKIHDQGQDPSQKPGKCSYQQNPTDTYVQSKASCREPAKSSYTLPAEKKTLSACHASSSARMELKPRPSCPDGLPVSAYSAFCRKVLVRRDVFERRRKISQLYIYIQRNYGTHR